MTTNKIGILSTAALAPLAIVGYQAITYAASNQVSTNNMSASLIDNYSHITAPINIATLIISYIATLWQVLPACTLL